MKKRMIGLLFLLPMLFSWNAIAQESEQAIFDATMKHVDYGGTFLNYVNVTELTPTIKNIAGLLEFLMLRESAADPEKTADVKAIVQTVFNLINLDAFKALAMSEKTNEKTGDDKIHTTKYHIHTGKNPTGIFFDFNSIGNQELSFQSMVPENAILADSCILTFNTAWEAFSREFMKSDRPNVKQIPGKISSYMKKANIDFPALLDTLSGKFFLLVTIKDGDDGSPKPQIMLMMPDRNAYLAQYFKENLPESCVKISENVYGITELPDRNIPEWMEPQIIFGEKSVTLVSHPDILKETAEAEKNGGLAKSKLAAPFMEGIQNKAAGWLYVKIEPSLLNHFASQFPIDLSSLIPKKPIVFYGVEFFEEEGYSGHFKSSISPRQTHMMLSLLPLFMTFANSFGMYADMNGTFDIDEYDDEEFEEFELED